LEDIYVDKSVLGRGGVPGYLTNNLALQGDRSRVGLHGTIRF
jgi:hypothetical protein